MKAQEAILLDQTKEKMCLEARKGNMMKRFTDPVVMGFQNHWSGLTGVMETHFQCCLPWDKRTEPRGQNRVEAHCGRLSVLSTDWI